jgi:hypothetical protein
MRHSSALRRIKHIYVSGLRQETMEKIEGGEKQMSTFTVSIYLSIEAETEEEARNIAYNLDVVPKNEVDEGKIYRDSENIEVEEE